MTDTASDRSRRSPGRRRVTVAVIATVLVAAAPLIPLELGVAYSGDGSPLSAVRLDERAAILEGAEWLAARHPGLDHRGVHNEHVFDGS